MSTSELSISVEGLGKRYRIGAQATKHETFVSNIFTTLRQPLDNLKRLAKLTSFSSEPEDDVIWAVKNVSFKVRRGELIGVIGLNGAGKSTLLKILSNITTPTEGVAKIYGRTASLLEVGTGFHPELTGRENVFLNGTILGMTRKEILKKFDEIVDFSEVEKFIDTPVKRYSSGMRVRLGFSVAAHLDPEILMVDEVLAVGDISFQNKCLGKLDDVVNDGRTVLFVSHNMEMIQRLCPRSILLDKGQIVCDNKTSETLKQYFDSGFNKLQKGTNLEQVERIKHYGQKFRISECKIYDSRGRLGQLLRMGEPFTVEMTGKANANLSDVYFGVEILNAERTVVTRYSTKEIGQLYQIQQGASFSIQMSFRDFVLNTGTYIVRLTALQGELAIDVVRAADSFNVSEISYSTDYHFEPQEGMIRCIAEVKQV